MGNNDRTLNTSVIGILLGLFQLMGYSPLPLIAAGILPHGMFEIPALVLSCAAVLHSGLVLVTPEGEAELKKIPFFVRGKARRNTERYAAERGIATITLETLYDAKAHFSR